MYCNLHCLPDRHFRYNSQRGRPIGNYTELAGYTPKPRIFFVVSGGDYALHDIHTLESDRKCKKSPGSFLA